MGNVCGRRGTERTGNVSRAGWPARVPCNPAPTVEFVSIAIRKVPGSKDVPAGGACPAPTDGGIFAAGAGQGQPRNVPAGRIARKGALQSGPYRWGNICGCRGTERTGNVPAGYRLGAVRGHHGTGVVGQCQRGVEDAAPYGGGSIRHKPKGFGRQGCSCGTDSPRGCPAIRPLRTGFLSVNKPQSSGRQGCACGRGVPRPYG